MRRGGPRRHRHRDRHLDCACDYGNEVEVGLGIARAIDEGLVTREDLWITSKLWNTYHAPEHVEPAIRRTLSDLGVEYVDLYLIHFPISLRYVPFEERYPPEWLFDPEAGPPGWSSRTSRSRRRGRRWRRWSRPA